MMYIASGGINIFDELCDLSDFGRVLNKTQAVGFYFIYLALFLIIFCIGIIFFAILGGIINDFEITAYILAMLLYLYPATITALIVKEKRLENKYYLLALLGMALTHFTLFFGGLIPAAYLTTREKR